jgi:hypothetical protein
MVTPIYSLGVSRGAGADGAGAADDRSVALQAQLSRCQRQLGDWEACASSKTPEGRKIIENLRSRIGALEAKVANTGRSATEKVEFDAPQTGIDFGGSAMAQQSAARLQSAMGSLLNVFA